MKLFHLFLFIFLIQLLENLNLHMGLVPCVLSFQNFFLICRTSPSLCLLCPSLLACRLLYPLEPLAYCCCSVAKFCPTLFTLMDGSTPAFPGILILVVVNYRSGNSNILAMSPTILFLHPWREGICLVSSSLFWIQEDLLIFFSLFSFLLVVRTEW